MFSFKQSAILFFARFWSLTGRSSRAEFWWGALLIFIIQALLSVLMRPLQFAIGDTAYLLIDILLLALTIAFACLFIRRLHDRCMRWYWVLFTLIPVLGWIFVVCVGLKPSFSFSNRYGIDPTSDVEGHFNFYGHRHFVRHGVYYGQTIHDYKGYQGDPNFSFRRDGGGEPFQDGFGPSPFQDYFRNKGQQGDDQQGGSGAGGAGGTGGGQSKGS